MTTTKHTLSELFFKKTGKVFRFNKKSELEKPVDFDDFYLIMIDAVGICNDKSVLDYDRLNLLYKTYTSVFDKNKNNFAETLTTRNKKIKISREKIFGELIPITKTVTNLDFFINRCYTNAEELLHKRQEQTSLNAFINKYGEEIGREKFNEFSEKRKKLYREKDDEFKLNAKKRLNRHSVIHPDYYKDKINPNTGEIYTEQEIVETIKQRQREFSKISSQKKKERNEKYHDVSYRQINYWLNKGYTYEEAHEKVTNIQATNTVETYVKKYGYELGVEEWKKRNRKWGEKMQEFRKNNGRSTSSYSKAATELFDTVLKKLSDDAITFEKVYYANNELSKWDSINKRLYFYDFVIDDIKLCVEYNGIMFHPKPGNYEWVCLYSGKSYEECIEYDSIKQQLIKDLCYELIVVWEDDIFEKSVDFIINKCKELIQNTIKN